jgi:hypothetical protein
MFAGTQEDEVRDREMEWKETETHPKFAVHKAFLFFQHEQLLLHRRVLDLSHALLGGTMPKL